MPKEPTIDSMRFLLPRDDKAPKKKTGRPKGRKDRKPRRKVRWMTKVKIVKEPRAPMAPKRPRGKPPHEPTAQTRHMVRKMVVTGHFRQEHIAECLGINPITLRKYYRDELKRAKGEFVTNIVAVMELKAIGGPPLNGAPNWREADASLLKFLAERVGGMVPIHKLHHSGTLGVFDPSKLTDAELAQIEAIHAKLAGELGTGSSAEGGFAQDPEDPPEGES